MEQENIFRPDEDSFWEMVAVGSIIPTDKDWDRLERLTEEVEDNFSNGEK